MKNKRYISNKEFAENDASFRKACEDIEIPPTKRQASKWRRGKGLAYFSRIR